MANIKEIADTIGVSAETVSQVLNGNYKGRTKKSRQVMRRVKREAERVNYRPHNAARSMRTRSTGLIGIVLEEHALQTHPVFSEVLKGFDQVANDAGYILTITSLTGIAAKTLESRIFKEQLIDGLAIMDISREMNINAMLDLFPNTVLINSNRWGPEYCVRRNEYAAGLTAGQELKKLGYRKAFYFDPEHMDPNRELYHYSVIDRDTGFRDGFSGDGLTVDRVELGTGEFVDWLEENRSTLTPDSVLIAGHNLRLYCLTSALARLDLKAGEDFGLVSLDDETGLLASFPDVSRVSFPRFEIGRIAGQMMVDMLSGENIKRPSVELTGEWINGTTTKEQPGA